MNISTTVIGVMSGCAARLATCCSAAPPKLFHEARTRLGRHRRSRLDDVHHEEPERDGDRHVDKEQQERAHREGPELAEPLELRDAHGERGEYERDHDEEQHAQEDLAERIEHERREAARCVEHRRKGGAGQERRAARHGPDREAQENAVGEASVEVRHGINLACPGTRRRPQW